MSCRGPQCRSPEGAYGFTVVPIRVIARAWAAGPPEGRERSPSNDGSRQALADPMTARARSLERGIVASARVLPRTGTRELAIRRRPRFGLRLEPLVLLAD